MMCRWVASVCLLWGGCACQKLTPATGASAVLTSTPANPVHRPNAPPPVDPLPVCETRGLEPLTAARAGYDRNDFARALSCAAEASAREPGNPDAHSERAAALSALGRDDDAKLAYARALALDPDHPDALLGAAHLYGVTLPSTRENDELAATYAARGRELARKDGDRELAAQFALLAAMAANDLGEAQTALDRVEEALAAHPRDVDAIYERAVALFELCRFPEAKASFTALLEDAEHGAHAHQHLGLILERQGKWKEAQRHFDRAHALAPEDFPPPELLSEGDFEKAVGDAVTGLPGDMRRDLTGVPVTAEELPRDDDLLDGDPPLSPTILGLFRGPSLDEPCPAEEPAPCRSVALYRRNLARAVSSRAELLEQIRVTLLHEVGHLRGEDDQELAARGLE